MPNSEDIDALLDGLKAATANEPADQLGALADPVTSLNFGKVLREIMGQMGGPKGFAKEVKRDFDAVDPGHTARIRIEADLLRSLQAYGEAPPPGKIEPEDEIAELKAAIRQDPALAEQIRGILDEVEHGDAT